MKRVETTLLLLRRDDQILLAKKKRGFGKGKYNGVGGKLDPGETPEQAMIRECQEEIEVTPTEYEKMGEMEFIELYNGEAENLIFHLYVGTTWEGEPTETEEMKPEWFNIDAIPYDQMFEGDQYWLPSILEGKKIKGYFEFDKDWKLLSTKIEDY